MVYQNSHIGYNASKIEWNSILREGKKIDFVNRMELLMQEDRKVELRSASLTLEVVHSRLLSGDIAQLVRVLA